MDNLREQQRQRDDERKQQEVIRKGGQTARDIAKAPELKQLEARDGTNFMHWLDGIKAFLYGFDLEDIVTGALETPVRKMSDEYCPREVRRQIYSKLIRKIDQRLLDQVRDVKQGEIEQLLSELNDLYYKAGSLNRHRLMDELFESEFEDALVKIVASYKAQAKLSSLYYALILNLQKQMRYCEK